MESKFSAIKSYLINEMKAYARLWKEEKDLVIVLAILIFFLSLLTFGMVMNMLLDKSVVYFDSVCFWSA